MTSPEPEWHWAEGNKYALEGMKVLLALNGGAAIALIFLVIPLGPLAWRLLGGRCSSLGFGALCPISGRSRGESFGRCETAYIKGSIGWVIEHYLRHPNFTGKAQNTRRNYSRVLDDLKRKLGAARIADLQPNHIRIVRDEFASLKSTAMAG